MVDTLTRDGPLYSPQWVDAFRTVPREKFIGPSFMVPDQTVGELVTYRTSDADEIVLPAVYSDNPLLTQFDAGATATSSSTAPSLMALMLEHLDAKPGHRVLEIGTGTGYNAALLCCGLGDEHVTTIDIDPDLVTSAAAHLHTAGYRPTCVTGDAHDGAAHHGPYDRIVATCAFTHIPTAWFSQLTPNAVVVVNVGFGLAILTHTTGGLSGPFVDQAAFMSARTDPIDVEYTARDAINHVENSHEQGRESNSVWIEDLDHPTVAMLRSLALSGVVAVQRHEPEGGQQIVLVDPKSGSWATARQTGGNAQVTSAGPRWLWNELVTLVSEWHDHKFPRINQYGLTVHPDGTHHLWLDHPNRPVRVF